jgi:hypothetical protein
MVYSLDRADPLLDQALSGLRQIAAEEIGRQAGA